jgi:hypothetical protein
VLCVLVYVCTPPSHPTECCCCLLLHGNEPAEYGVLAHTTDACAHNPGAAARRGRVPCGGRDGSGRAWGQSSPAGRRHHTAAAVRPGSINRWPAGELGQPGRGGTGAAEEPPPTHRHRHHDVG